MPNIKSAIKKMKQDVSRTNHNNTHRNALDDVIRFAKNGVTKAKKEDFIAKAYTVIDKASKKNVIHANKASRLKSRISRLVSHSA
ncbi:MAG: 30S ribosomal protein S20 [bacterium]|nr:30S ribosomal protein S20 [bacterium]